MKAAGRSFRFVRTLPVLAALALAGFASSGCNANLSPYSAIVNGDRISQQQLNDVMAVDSKGAYACLVASGGSTTQIQGASPDTFSMGFAGLQLSYLVESTILEQAAAEEGVPVGPIAQAIGKQQIDAVFASEAASAGCSTDVLKSMPQALQEALVSLEASVYALGAHLVGTELTVDGLSDYAAAHPEDTHQACVLMIETESTAKAEQLAAEIKGGASFEHVAKTSSIAPDASKNGGNLGCFVPSTKLPPPVAHAAATIPIGQVSDPIPAGREGLPDRGDEPQAAAVDDHRHPCRPVGGQQGGQARRRQAEERQRERQPRLRLLEHERPQRAAATGAAGEVPPLLSGRGRPNWRGGRSVPPRFVRPARRRRGRPRSGRAGADGSSGSGGAA